MRLQWLDNLRITAGLAVVLLHVSGFVYRGFEGEITGSWLWGNIYNSGSRWCVALFVMISGYLLLRPGADQPAWQFLRRRLVRMLPALVAWPIIYMAYTFLSFGRPENLRTALGAMVWRGDAFYHLWFVYMIAGLYLLTPWLRRWRNSMPLAVQVAVCLLIFLVNLRLPGPGAESLGPLLRLPAQPMVMTISIPFLGYFLLGGLLHASPDPERPWPWGVLFMVAMAATVAGTAWRAQAAGLLAATHILQVDLAPGVVVMTVSLFQFWRAVPRIRLGGPWHDRMAGSIFGIYLIHPLVMEALWRVGLNTDGLLPAITIPVTTLTVFMLSWACTRGLRAIPIVRRLV